MNTTALLDQLVDLLHLAGEQDILPRQGLATSREKLDGSLVTDADMAVHQRLLDRLPRILAAPVLSEELAVAEVAEIRQQAAFWCIDPIDGTQNFARGLPNFGISVAFIRNGRPELAAVFAPVAGEMFYAARGEGAWLDGRRLDNRQPIPGGLVGCVNIKRLPLPLRQALVQHPPYEHFRYHGACALELCDLAAGRMDVYLSGPTPIWDYAAAALIVEEAGGKISPSVLPAADTTNLLVATASQERFDKWADWIAVHCPECAIA